MTDDATEYPARPVKSRKRRYRERRQEADYHQIAVWLDGDAYYLLRHFMTTHTACAADVISAALRHYATVPRDTLPVPRDVPRDTLPVPRDDSANIRRYLPPALEDRIVELRESGLSVRETARQLAEEGHLNSKGKPYGPSTIKGAADRAKVRHS